MYAKCISKYVRYCSSNFSSYVLCFQKELMKESLEIVIPKLLHAAGENAAKVNSWSSYSYPRFLFMDPDFSSN